jgi:hypothetical protein
MTRSIRAPLVLALTTVAAGWLAAAQAQAPQGVPPLLPPISSTPAKPAGSAARPAEARAPAKPVIVAGHRVIAWEDLVPAGWDPMKEFRDLDLNVLNDNDARAITLMRRMREVWDNAPSNPALEGQAVRIPGFVVPLEETRDGIKEFLLVPYFGACVHTPPPPANQIVHVLPQTAAKNVRSMDAVWVSGIITRTRTDSFMGTSSYRLEARQVEPYSAPR